MKQDKITRYCVESLQTAGAEKAQCTLNQTEKKEFSIEFNRINLLRTTVSTRLTLTAFLNQKKGEVTLNGTDRVSLDAGIEQTLEVARASRPDDAHDISEYQPAKCFSKGPEEADTALMHDRIAEFLDSSHADYPSLIYKRGSLGFNRSVSRYFNSNQTDIESRRGYYHFDIQFSTKEGENASSFNYTSFFTQDLNQPFRQYAMVDELLRQTGEQLNPKPFNETIQGDVIFTPDCLDNFMLYFVYSFLSDAPIISGTSIFKDHLDRPVASPLLTLSACPVSDQLAIGYSFTEEGFETQNCPIIENGVLKTFLLSQYGANKSGKARAPNMGSTHIIEPGDTPLTEMIKDVKRGVLLSRLSGGAPSENGDFSGVAKNSYYIENGRIQYPLNETMISANYAAVMKNIVQISKERVNFGHTILPWMRVGNVTISGK